MTGECICLEKEKLTNAKSKNLFLKCSKDLGC